MYLSVELLKKLLSLWLFPFFSLPSHHIHEFSEVNRAGVVLVHLSDNLLQVLLSELGVDLPEYLLQNISADVALLVFVVNPTVRIILE